MNARILVLCPFAADPGLLSEAVRLSGGQPVRALVPESDAEAAAAAGVQYVHTLPGRFPAEDEDAFALWLSRWIRRWDCGVILAPASVRMRAVMPALAWRLHAGLTADCTHLALENGRLLQTRPAFGSSVMAEIAALSSVQMATVRPGVFPVGTGAAVCAEFFRETPPEPGGRVRRIGGVPLRGGVPLAGARVVVAGGLGIGSKAGFDRLGELAARMGAALAASRGAVDAGFAPYRCQVGMTGVTVAPRLYLAFGISGAVQHLAGMSGAARVAAVNSDPGAPIFDHADLAVVADWRTVADGLWEELS